MACCWYTLLLPLEQWEILGTHVTLAGVQLRHKSPPLGEPGEANRGHVFISSVHETPSYSESSNVFQIPAFNILGKETLYLFPRQPMLDSQHFSAHSVVILAHTALCEPHTWGMSWRQPLSPHP